MNDNVLIGQRELLRIITRLSNQVICFDFSPTIESLITDVDQLKNEIDRRADEVLYSISIIKNKGARDHGFNC